MTSMNSTPGGVDPSEWTVVDGLIKDQKLQEAAAKVDALLAKARQSRDQPTWAKALIRSVQLHMALGAYETAVRSMKEQPWPDELLPHAACELFYAHALVGYLDQYSWEIRQRERVASGGTVDLKAWTADQIYQEALAAYDAVWAQRDALGKEPVDRLGEFLQPNNYPSGVRSTLRDAVSYLAAQLLASAAYWTPEQANELYRLDVAALAVGLPAARLKLAAADVHPLARAVAVTADLEAWHRHESEADAELEAHLERVRLLHAAFTGAAQRELLVKHLTQLLPDFRRHSWWAMGMAELAQLHQTAGRLVTAHATAQAGAAAYPKAVGGQRCLSLARTLEAPDYEMTSMATDRAQRRSVEVRHRNLTKLYFRAYAFDLRKQIEGARDYNLLPGGRDYRKLGGRPPDAAWEVELPATPDLSAHHTYVTPPLTAPGLYLIAASARADFKDVANRIITAPLLISNLVLLTRPDDGAVDATVVDGEAGAPVAGAAVTLYRYDYQKGHHAVETAQADSQGGVRFRRKPGSDYGSYFLIAAKGAQLALDAQYLSLSAGSGPSTERQASFVYTDRSVYRPLQKLLWKVVAYRGRPESGNLRVSTAAAVTMTLLDGNGKTVATKAVKTNAFGSASGEFAIPAGKLLGQWTLRSSYGGGQAAVRVEEYKRPTFEVSFKDPETPLRLNRPAELKGYAKYYFGLPVVTGAVRWKVTREPVYPWWWGFYYGGAAARGNGQAQTIAAGTSAVDGDGSFKVTFLPAADESGTGAGKSPDKGQNKSLSYRYSVTGDLTDEGGETRSASRGFRLGFTAVEAVVDADVGFFTPDQAAPVSIRRATLDGLPRAGAGRFRLVKLRQPATTAAPADLPPGGAPTDEDGTTAAGTAAETATITPGDRLRPRWRPDYSPAAETARWADGDEVARGDLTHDAQGLATATLPALPSGAYRLRYETVDDFGDRFETFKDLLVGGHQPALALPAVFAAQAATVPVGGTARFLVHSGRKGQRLYFELFQGGKLRERRVLTAGADALIELPVTEADRGGLAATLTSVVDHQLLSFSQSVRVPWDDKALELEFSTFRDKLRPGQTEAWRLHVKGPRAAQVTAEVLAYMYDRSLDLFAAPAVPAPLAIYPARDQAQWLRANLGEAGGERVTINDFASVPSPPSLYPDRLKAVGAYGVGGLGRRRFQFGAAGSPAGMLMEAAPAPMEARATDKLETTREAYAAVAKAPAASAPQAPPGTPPGPAGAPQLRANFAETAFFQPHLLTDAHGDVALEFQVPDSVTAWSVWVVALTKDLSGGALRRDAHTVKDLMVRPYLPRFLREGDRAELKVVVNNATAAPLAGELTLDITDAETGKSLADAFGLATARQAFKAPPGGGANVTFPLSVPRRVGLVAVKVTARSGGLSDGEVRPLPVLPSRLHLQQSRFVTLRDAETRTMSFPDLATADDPTRTNDSLVVGVDGQLFYSVLNALPYLVTYPYECTEQTLNRFLATGIVSSVYAQYPAVAAMALQLSKRATRLAPWDKDDPNRRMALEETPWLEEARGGQAEGDAGPLVSVLDERIAKAQRDSALAKLTLAQTAGGGFPWFAGGPPSPWITLYLMHGFAKAAEFSVPVPKAVVAKGWAYLGEHFRKDYAERLVKDDCCWEFLTFLNYTASAYPDPSWLGGALTAAERATILAHSFKHWREHSPLLKAYLALTLKRAGRLGDAKLVWASVMDSARTEKDQGTFWAPEDRAWLWYNDTIETQAFALRTLMELDPQNAKKDGLVLWLFLNKKLNHWKSTRATAEVIYALVHYLKGEHALGLKETATVDVGGVAHAFAFDPARYTGRAELVVPGSQVVAKMATVTAAKQTKGVMFASATWHFSTDRLPTAAAGDFFTVTRRFFKRGTEGKETVLRPLTEGALLAAGDELEVQLALTSKHEAEYVHLRDPRGAGFEPVSQASRYRSELGLGYYEEVRDSGANFFLEHLPVGQVTFKYRVRAAMAGVFRVGPATVQSMYAPEFAAYSAGDELRIAP